MAENRNITWNVTLKIAGNVTTPFPIILRESKLSEGKWTTSPPAQMTAHVGQSGTYSFGSKGAACSARGTQGTATFASIDGSTVFNFLWDIPYSSSNSGNVSMTNEIGSYTITGGFVPRSGNSVTVEVTITQIAPTV